MCGEEDEGVRESEEDNVQAMMEMGESTSCVGGSMQERVRAHKRAQ
jgi:hypothetical protein